MINRSVFYQRKYLQDFWGLMIGPWDEKYNHTAFEQISCKESQLFQNSIICYTKLLESKIKI